jgi:hypothetical protein
MDAHKLVVKFFANPPAPVKPEEFVPVFHSWIQTHAVDDHLLVDVADYSHAHHGPGTVLIAQEGNFSTDLAEGRLGLMYNRKTPLPGDVRQRLAFVFAATLRACQLLEQDPRLSGRLTFATHEVLLRINDRLLAPNTPETWESLRAQIAAFVAQLYDDPAASIDHRGSPQELFEVRITTAKRPTITVLLDRLSQLLPAAAAR